MADAAKTDWSLLGRAAEGDAEARADFAREHLGTVREWCRRLLGDRASPVADEDLVQDVFMECLRPGGALEGALERSGSLRFRAWLRGVARKVMLRHLEAAARSRPEAGVSLLEDARDEARASRLFDRVWAERTLALAAQRMADRAPDDAARQRVELLRLRFAEGLPVRRIAAAWQQDAAKVHRAYARAREEYKDCLREVVSERTGVSGAACERACEELIELL